MRGDPIAIAHRQLVTARSVAFAGWTGQMITFDAELDRAELQPDPMLAIAAPDGSVRGPVRIFDIAKGEPVNASSSAATISTP